MTPAELRADPWAGGPWCWVVGEVKLLPEPIPFRGMQGLWPLPADVRLALWTATGLQVGAALTLLQPYASAVASGEKTVENRPWRRTIPEGGLWVGLHAGKALYCPFPDARPAERDAWVRNQLLRWRREERWLEAPELADLPRGMLLGAMRIDEIVAYPANAGGSP